MIVSEIHQIKRVCECVCVGVSVLVCVGGSVWVCVGVIVSMVVCVHAHVWAPQSECNFVCCVCAYGSVWMSMCDCVQLCACLFVCVCERERERERSIENKQKLIGWWNKKFLFLGKESNSFSSKCRDFTPMRHFFERISSYHLNDLSSIS